MMKSGELERVFHYCDEDGDGKISPTELRHCVATVGVGGELLLPEDVEAVVNSLDSDGDGLLGLEDFVGLMEGGEEEEKTRDLKEAFGMYVMDQEGSECITPMSLRTMLRRLGESKTIDECTVMISQFDLNGDGVLTFDEFRAMML